MTIPDYFVRVIELPRAVRGVTVPNDDGTFSVYINSLYDDGIQRETLEHELAHLARDHFYKAGSIAVQEAEASGRTGVGTASAERCIRLYPSLQALEDYLRSIDALDRPLEEFGRRI